MKYSLSFLFFIAALCNGPFLSAMDQKHDEPSDLDRQLMITIESTVLSPQTQCERITSLVQAGVNIERPHQGRTPLFHAFGHNKPAIVHLLIRLRANTKLKHEGDTILHLAAAFGYDDVIRLIHNLRIFDINEPNDDGVIPLSKAAHQARQQTVALLIQLGSNIMSTDRWGQSPLFYAARNKNLNVMNHLVSLSHPVTHISHFNINARSHNGLTPLGMAAENENYASVLRLLELGADATLFDDNRTNALLWMISHIEKDHPNINQPLAAAQALVNAGASIDLIDIQGSSPLLIAADYDARHRSNPSHVSLEQRLRTWRAEYIEHCLVTLRALRDGRQYRPNRHNRLRVDIARRAPVRLENIYAQQQNHNQAKKPGVHPSSIRDKLFAKIRSHASTAIAAPTVATAANARP